jgi:hypothetical protein
MRTVTKCVNLCQNVALIATHCEHIDHGAAGLL